MGSPLRLCFALLTCVGCGAVKDGQLPDAPPAPPVDAAPAIDAAPTTGLVRVTVLDPGGSGAPAVGATALFVNPDDTLVKRVATNSAGKAEAEVMIGASVTSVVLVGTVYQIQTVLGVKPGDDIVLGARTNDSTAAGTMKVTFPTIGGATFYEVSGPCFGNGISPPVADPTATVTLFMQAHCKLDVMEIVVAARDNLANVLQSVHKTGVAFVDGGTVTMPSYDGLRTFTGSFTNIHPMISEVSLTRAVPDGFGISTSASMNDPAATTPLMLTGPTATTARTDTAFSLESGSQQRVRQNLAGTAATYGLDVGATLLPWLSAPPMFDPASGKLVVPIDPTGTGAGKPDAFRLTATYTRLDEVTQTTTRFSWTVFAAEPSDITLPTLPAELALAPRPTDTFSPMNATMFEADTVTGYDMVRSDLNRAFLLYAGNRYPAATVRLSSSPQFRR